MYEAIVTVHILSGMTWVGAAIVFVWGSHNIRAERGDAEAIEIGDRFEGAITLVTFTPFLVVATGVAQVLMSQQHDWSDLWVVLALVLVASSFALGWANDASFKKAQEQSASDGAVPSKAYDLSTLLLWAELGLMIAIVALMVFKPT